MWLAIAISLLGAAVTTGGIFATRLCDSWTQRNIDHFISFAAGVLIAVSFLHLVPEALGLTRLAPGGLLVGYGVMHILDRFVVGHVCNRPQTERFALGLVPLVALGFHSLLDGLVYSIGFNVSTLTGLAVATGMIAHEFPEGVVIYALLRCSGFSARRSTLLAFAAAGLTTPLGTVLSYSLVAHLPDPALGLLLAGSGGALIYVGATHLLPQTAQAGRKPSLAALASGFLVAIGVSLTRG